MSGDGEEGGANGSCRGNLEYRQTCEMESRSSGPWIVGVIRVGSGKVRVVFRISERRRKSSVLKVLPLCMHILY